jgi:hypothetical protein
MSLEAPYFSSSCLAQKEIMDDSSSDSSAHEESSAKTAHQMLFVQCYEDNKRPHLKGAVMAGIWTSAIAALTPRGRDVQNPIFSLLEQRHREAFAVSAHGSGARASRSAVVLQQHRSERAGGGVGNRRSGGGGQNCMLASC